MPKKKEQEKKSDKIQILHIKLSQEAMTELQDQAEFEMRTVTSIATMILEKVLLGKPFERGKKLGVKYQEE